jgi:hypothetical protein
MPMTRFHRVRPVCHLVAAAVVAALSSPVRAAGQDYPPPPADYDVPVTADTDWSDQIPAHVYVVDGASQLERDGQAEPLEENEPLLAGDRLRTARGRVEVLYADGSSLSLDDYSEVDLLSEELIRLNAGRIRLSIARGASDLAYRVDASGTTTLIRTAGDYDIAIDPRGTAADADVRVRVLRGAAELSSSFGRTLVQTGFEARANARLQPSLPYAVNVSAYDNFDRWVEDQYRYRTGARSAQYLPAELRHYGGSFDRDGRWEYEGGYGYVWYPTVAADWRPYYHGGWSFVGSFGWTWIGAGRWNWPTHHYGRWGHRTGRWFWIPGRRWAPAWVAWGSAPGFVSWCPLGFDNRPVFALTNITAYRSGFRHGWTILPTQHFRSRVAVSRFAVRTLPVGIGSRFVGHHVSPVRPVLRTTRTYTPLRAPTYAATRYAVPRSRAVETGAAAAPAGAVAPARAARSRSTASGRAGAAAVAPAADRPQAPVVRSRPRSAQEATPGSTDAPAPARQARPRGPRSAPSSRPDSAAPNAPPNRGSEAPPSRRAVGRRSSSSLSPLPDIGPVQRSTPSRRAPAVRAERPSPSAAPLMTPSPRLAAPARSRLQAGGSSRPSAARAVRPAPRIDRPSPAPSQRIERAPASRAPRVQRSSPAPASRVQRSAPARAPQIDRPSPSRAPSTAGPRSRSAGAAAGGQARSRGRSR